MSFRSCILFDRKRTFIQVLKDMSVSKMMIFGLTIALRLCKPALVRCRANVVNEYDSFSCVILTSD